MKIKYSILILLSTLFIFSACNKTEFEPMKLNLLTDAERWTKTHSYDELIQKFSTPLGIHPDSTRSNSGSMGLYTVDTIPKTGSPIVITGRVVSSDIEGNIYKSLVIQEENSTAGLKISINVSSSSAIYPIGQLLRIKCNGLVIGKYADLFQLGVDYYNLDYSRTDNVTIDYTKTGYEPGRIPFSILKNCMQLDGLPESNKIKVDTVTINDILTSAGRYEHSRIVCIKNAKFTGNEFDVNKNPVPIAIERNRIFAPSTQGYGFPQSREIKDGTASIAIATSEYANFAKQPLPASSYVGNLTAIVGWYRDKAGFDGSWQLTLRSLSDLGTGFDAYLTEINYKK